MKLATLAEGGADGTLVLISKDGERYLKAANVAKTLQFAIDNWATLESDLLGLSQRLEQGEGEEVADITFVAPLPRAWQWLDASAFRSHGELMEKVFGIDPVPQTKPLMYQGVSDKFYGPTEDVYFPTEEDDIDFEGEFGIIVDETPMGVSPEEAKQHIKLIVLINDWSLRKLAAPEMKTGFGWVQAKPACSMSPLAVTPDTLGDYWRDGRVQLNLSVEFNGETFGNAHGGAMGYGFHELVAHAAATRDLCAGTVIGSGTVSNENYREIGSSCIAERRGIELIDLGAPKTGFMRFGDSVRMSASLPDSADHFGVIEQKVVQRDI
ncbi:MAG: fumarylacetoacetate hydrolase [SAR86 cluster bacterium]|uniref:Fumarylacetoacetate hydrolase n=1 Tax=SAR86 cluster bacterium TaxID=2030880 RepID=A0A2A5C8L9_9GAMM|nr:MAG: fumarylacetoacetate hydrolase [SAR86 cluster bacterium]